MWTIGCHNHIYPNSVIGGEPQDTSYRGSDTKIVIGDHNIIRECVTINRASEKEDGVTRIGDHNFLMACCHVGARLPIGEPHHHRQRHAVGGHVSRTRSCLAFGGGGGAPFRHRRAATASWAA